MSAKKKRYVHADLEAAIVDVRLGMPKNAAAKKYGIPRATMQFHMKEENVKRRPGPSPILTEEEEHTLKKWIIESSNKGFSRRKADVITSVKEFLELNNRPHPFTDNTPGIGWYRAFLKRHPEITTRTSEAVTSASSCVSEKDIRSWFTKITQCLKDEDKFGILQHPERIFNADETSFLLNPNNSKVLGPKGARNVYEVEKGNSKSSITVMLSFSASGAVVPPMVVFPYQKIPTEIGRSVPDSWGIGRSDKGWMKAEVFYEYIGNIFVPFLKTQNIPTPVILFVDGHKSHLTCQISELCTQLGVVLIALYPNATRILQPADVAAFRPIKEGWRKEVLEWHRKHPNEYLKKDNFCSVLKNVLTNSLKTETLKNGFRTCGLFPWNPDAIDYSKCLGNGNSEPSVQTQQTTEDALPKLDYVTYKNLVGKNLIEKFETVGNTNEENHSNEFCILLKIWDEVFQKGIPGLKKNVCETINTCGEAGMTYSANETEYEKTPQLESGGETPAYSESENTLENNTVISNVLSWPETPKRKGKRNTERQPFVITSTVWKKLQLEKASKKQEELQKKEERKRKREERKQGKKEKAPSKKGRSKYAIKSTKTPKMLESSSSKQDKCHGCARKIRSEKRNFLECSLCRKLFHNKCIPTSHQDHVPNQDDCDKYVCHLCYVIPVSDEDASIIMGESENE